mgnify:CR=1 FL=1
MSIDDVASHYMESVPLSKSLPINVGLSSARDTTMASILGSPHQPLTTSCQNSLASDKTQSLRATRKFTPHLRTTGVTPALDSLERVLAAAFAAVKAGGIGLYAATKCAAEKLMNGNAISLSGDVPQRNVHGADSRQNRTFATVIASARVHLLP